MWIFKSKTHTNSHYFDEYLFSITSRFIRTRHKLIEKNKWSDSWVINRFDFRKTIVSLKKIFNLSSSFAFRHSRKFFKDISISCEFVNLRLYLSKKFSSLIQSFDLVDQILLARQQSQLTKDRLILISSSLTSASSISHFSDIFIKDFVFTTSVESLNMSKFSEFSN
jgi:uncharacterized protein VirK/YbjX